ncbi:UV-damage endonuclease [Exophiala bonariae]|uniref:UV-damage endonuclease n=1 Tax=Exophiala bonariae TaxID=1690606 RepID=A0AAV9N6D9_9EURO|nr:UV-damage endonuclease [Exophiala bonariae]
MAKRKRPSSTGVANSVGTPADLPINLVSTASNMMAPTPGRRMSSRQASMVAPANIDTNPDTNPKIQDAPGALRASPDAELAVAGSSQKRRKGAQAAPGNSAANEKISNSVKSSSPTRTVKGRDDEGERGDPEEDGPGDADPEELKEALSRPPPVNSAYLPLPWKGRLGYACLNTYLRYSNPPVFSSRTCRIASILEHRHPLRDPTQPEHSTKNRPDKDQPADIARGQAYVEALGIANARDIVKMLRWNDKYGIKFLRLSSEMFPFASHDVYGYTLAPFASEVLAKAGAVAAELGHRLTTHPGQFTQLGSPRKEVITAAIRDLDYHCELLDLLKLPEQQNRDAVMILHMGGVFGDKAATIARFKESYLHLPQKVKNRLVLENDDVCYTVHDLLPVCEELNIPLVLDYHHHNILFDADKIREGTLDIMDLYPRIRATWTRKGITQKMHYSEPTPPAITGRQRRKHNPRVATLPPCADDMDLMIEAKDKEQAVFELMRTFKLPGFDTFNDIQPHVRNDENKPWKPPKKPKKTPAKKKNKTEQDEEDSGDEPEPLPPAIIPEKEVGMGGPEGRVYWPPGMEEWLRPKKREVKPRDPEKAKTTAERAAARRAEKASWQATQEANNGTASRDTSASASTSTNGGGEAAGTNLDLEATKSVYDKAKSSKTKAKPARAPKSKSKPNVKAVLTPSTSDHDDEDPVISDDEDLSMPDLTDGDEAIRPVKVEESKKPRLATRASSGRNARRKVNYTEQDED